MQRVVLLLVLSLAMCFGQLFTADIEISGTPGLSGTITGKMYYDYPNRRIRIDYNLQGPGRPIEIINYSSSEQVRYLGCSTAKCNAESFKSPMPIYHKISETSPLSGTQSWATCAGSRYSRSGVSTDKEVSKIAFDSSDHVCTVILVDGTKIAFTNYVAQSSLAASLWDISGWGCPQKQCNVQIDLAIVLDCSGSVAGEWTTEKNFALQFAQSFTISETAVKIGLVTFGTQSYLEFDLLNDKNSVTAGINGAPNHGGNTCIGCGLYTATRYLLNGPRSRSGVQKVIVLVTDGQNNVFPRPFSDDVAYAKSGGTWIFVIGVTSSVNVAELKQTASGSNGQMVVNGNTVTTYWGTPSFSQLSGILNQLIAATCQDLQGNPCGTTCKGFCACDRTCVCPDKCTLPDQCLNYACSNSSNGAGCYTTPVNCVDNDACTDDTCDSATGCVHTFNPSCPPKNCFTSQCVSPVGCVYTAVNCDDGNPCTADYCDTSDGVCKRNIVPCDLCKDNGQNATTCSVGKPLCEKWDCVQPDIYTYGCQQVGSVQCDDQNECTTELCDPNTGTCVYTNVICDDNNNCTVDSCDPSRGCVYTGINVTDVCNDFSVCTNDTCDPILGCQNTIIPCTGGNACTDNNACDSITGCFYPSLVCADIPDFKAKINDGDCYLALCNDGTNPNITEPLGCYLQQRDGTTVDDCGVCNGDGNSCLLGVGLVAVASIGAGVLAAIIIGVIVGVLAVGAIAGKKGYDAYMRNKRDMGGAQNNALYVDPGTSGNNPFYEMNKR